MTSPIATVGFCAAILGCSCTYEPEPDTTLVAGPGTAEALGERLGAALEALSDSKEEGNAFLALAREARDLSNELVKLDPDPQLSALNVSLRARLLGEVPANERAAETRALQAIWAGVSDSADGLTDGDVAAIQGAAQSLIANGEKEEARRIYRFAGDLLAQAEKRRGAKNDGASARVGPLTGGMLLLDAVGETLVATGTLMDEDANRRDIESRAEVIPAVVHPGPSLTVLIFPGAERDIGGVSLAGQLRAVKTLSERYPAQVLQVVIVAPPLRTDEERAAWTMDGPRPQILAEGRAQNLDGTPLLAERFGVVDHAAVLLDESGRVIDVGAGATHLDQLIHKRLANVGKNGQKAANAK